MPLTLAATREAGRNAQGIAICFSRQAIERYVIASLEGPAAIRFQTVDYRAETPAAHLPDFGGAGDIALV